VIWFCSWLSTLVIMTLIWAIYHLGLNGDVAILSREVAEATPRGWPDVSPFAVPALQVSIYVLAVFFWWSKRREIERRRRFARGSSIEAGRLLKLGMLLENPAHGRLTIPFLPFVTLGVALSFPLVSSGLLRPSIWGFCALWVVTLAMQAVFLRDRPVIFYPEVREDAG
jgi:hypothetical protein